MVANVFHQGFFRSWHDDETYEQILNQMQEDHSVRWMFSVTMLTVLEFIIILINQLLYCVILIFQVFPVENRGQIIDDAFNLARWTHL